ncbi:MBL fold metallo-hydrolase [Halomonas pacifica]|uniref:MBL fold metallo-hydrolase n=1 Tax=Bisbaumannia pacifica TaxID=77098 RepID=A0A510X8E3_9GAMM|nr:MBL fold metallo-hydrolase [Halomonas pacifica]MBH8581358.1 MBL fold metallo-hydrolase [Halomonas pacifica]MDC8805397.1 MBL fold metallo-hydrolase [Halomonas pacifica]GEK47719.1 oxidoreductase [Halomonas pacifica]
MSKQFASHADTEEKQVSFTKLADGLYAYTAEGDPNTGIIIGDDSVMVVDTQATPIMAQDVIRRIREVTDLPIKHVVMSHYHAVRVLGASAYEAENIYASRNTYELIKERGQQDYESEVGRFPRLFQGVDSVPGLTWPNVVFERELTVFMGNREVRIMHLGKGHTRGDTVVWLPEEKVLFSGDQVEYGATPYSGDAYHEEWPATLDKLLALEPEQLVPGRGDALTTPALCREAIEGTRDFLLTMYNSVKAGKAAGKSLSECYAETYALMKPKYGHWVIFDHCLPFDITRCYDEAGGEYPDPRIWTAERDQEMWHSLQDVVENQ